MTYKDVTLGYILRQWVIFLHECFSFQVSPAYVFQILSEPHSSAVGAQHLSSDASHLMGIAKDQLSCHSELTEVF